MSLIQAQDRFRADLDSGTHCPVCTRYVAVYSYSVGIMLSKLLDALISKHGQAWVPTSQFPMVVTPRALRGKVVTNYNMLKHFDLLEQHPEATEWRVTDTGVKFRQGECTIPAKILVCLDQCLSKSIEQSTFAECLSGSRRRVREMIAAPLQLPAILSDCNLEDAIARHRADVAKGLNCVICGRWNQVYARVLGKSMVKVLIRLHQLSLDAPAGTYFHVYNEVERTQSGDYAQMKFWNLIEADPSNDGYWRITEHGRAFATNEVAVKAYAVTLNDVLLTLAGGDVLISQAFSKRFRKPDLLAACA